MGESKYCISIGEVEQGVEGYSKTHKIELDNDAATFVISTPKWLCSLSLAILLQKIGSITEGTSVYYREIIDHTS
jgi:hypothetical protein